MKKKLFRKKDYDFRKNRKKKFLANGGVFFLILTFLTVFAFFLQNENNTALADAWQDGCNGGATETNIADCESWTSSGYSENTTVTSTTICVTEDCSGDQVLTLKEGDPVTLYVVTNVYNGSNANRYDGTAATTNFTESASGLNLSDGDCTTTIASTANSWGTPCVKEITMTYDEFINNANINNDGELRFSVDTGVDIRCSDGKQCYNTSITTNSQSSIIVEKQEEKKIEQCPPGLEQLSKTGDELQCGTKTTTTDQSTKIITRYHKTAPGEYLPTIAIDKLNHSGIPGSTKYSTELGNLNSKTNPLYSLSDPKVYDFYPNDLNPITTKSIAKISTGSKVISTMLNSIDYGFITDQSLCAPYAIQTVSNFFELIVKGIPILAENYRKLKDANPLPDDAPITDVFLNFFSTALQSLAITMGDENVQSVSVATGLALAQAGKCEKAITEGSLNGFGDRITKTIENDSMPTPMVSEGQAYLQPGEKSTITAYAYLPSNKFYYDWYVTYTQTFTTVTTNTNNTTTGTSETDSKTYLTEMHVDATDPIRHYELTGGKAIDKDSKIIRRLGNIYGTSFTTKLKSIETKNGANSLLPKKPESNQLDSALVTARAYYEDGEDYENDDEKSDSKTYGEKVFAGSDHKSSIVATFQHAATARSNSTISDDAICENTMSKYDIDWWIDGKLITTENANILSTKPFNLEKNNKNGNGCNTSKNPLEVAGSNVTTNNQYSSLEIKNTENLNSNDYYKIPLGTFGKEYTQGGRIASQYDMDGSKTLQPSKNQIKAEVGFKVYRPWNYKLSIPSVTNSVADGYLLAGEGDAAITVTVKNEANDSDEAKRNGQEGNPSYSPEVTIDLYKTSVTNKSELDSKNKELSRGELKNIDSELVASENIGQLDYVAKPDTEKTKGHTFTDDNASAGDPGSHVCYYARINYKDSVTDTDGSSYGGAHGYGTPSNNYVYSGLTCFTLIGFPTAQIWGGNVFSAGSINTRVFEGSNYALGSWADYGIISRGSVLGLASGKTLPEGNATPPIYNCQNHPLTINNSGTSANPDGDDCGDPIGSSGGLVASQVKNLGNSQITAPRTLSKLRNIYGNKTGGTELNSTAATYLDGIRYSCYDSGSYTTKRDNCNDSRFRYTSSGGDLDLTSDDGKLPIGITHVIYATGNITINTNLTYTEPSGGYTNLNQIPQYIIIADGNIKIGEGVTEVNAWLIAGADGDGNGELNTCVSYDEYGNDKVVIKDEDGYPKENDYNMEVCGKNLTINGPVFANKVMLRRTSGSTKDKFTSPAEKFDLTPLSYYWAFYQASQAGRASTVYLRSLPPRY